MIDWGAIALKFDYSDPKELVYDLYWKQGLSLNEIADELVVSVTALVKFMKDKGIERRDLEKVRKQIISGPPCPSCGNQKTKITGSWGMTKKGYERERRCKECGRYFRTVETVIQSGRTWRRKNG